MPDGRSLTLARDRAIYLTQSDVIQVRRVIRVFFNKQGNEPGLWPYVTFRQLVGIDRTLDSDFAEQIALRPCQDIEWE